MEITENLLYNFSSILFYILVGFAILEIELTHFNIPK